MYINKCTKCGAEFETKNPKRVICPNCLYPDRKPILDANSDSTQEKPQMRSSYSYDGGADGPQRAYSARPRQNYQRQNNNNRLQGSYNQGGYNRSQGNYNRPQQRTNNYNRSQNDKNKYNRTNRSQQGRRPQQRRPQNTRQHKELLINKEQLAQIEALYKLMLPLPNYNAHETIGAQVGLEPRKVFFGINLIRQKMFLPKLPYPKRKLAVSPDQLSAIKNLYEPLLPLPPIGCHKIIANQLKMDEWRVHVGIGLIRKQMGLDRWNENREDAPAQIIRPRKGLSEADKVLENDERLNNNAETKEQEQ